MTGGARGHTVAASDERTHVPEDRLPHLCIQLRGSHFIMLSFYTTLDLVAATLLPGQEGCQPMLPHARFSQGCGRVVIISVFIVHCLGPCMRRRSRQEDIVEETRHDG